MRKSNKFRQIGIAATLTTTMVETMVGGSFADVDKDITPVVQPKDGNEETAISKSPATIV